MKAKEHPITRSLAMEVFDLHGTPEWENPWKKIVDQYPDLKPHRGNLLLIMEEETGYCCVTIKDTPS